ncbi:MAG: hypothetical protein ACYC2H_00520 [Thermoplasmatota archaeon]
MEATAQAFGIPPPPNLEDVSGPWGHFVVCVSAYNAGKLVQAAAEARSVIAAPEVPGFPGMKETAQRIKTAAESSMTGVAVVRKFRTGANVDIPSVPLDADFSKPEWMHYQAAVEHVRSRDYEAARLDIHAGLKLIGFENDANAANWYLKRLGAAISRAIKGGQKYPLNHVPASPEEAVDILLYFGVTLPPRVTISDPIWACLAKAYIAYDHNAWQTAYHHIDEARFLRAETLANRDEADRLLDAIEAKQPHVRRPKKFPLRQHPDVRPANRVHFKPK